MGLKTSLIFNFSIFLHPHHQLLPNIYLGLQTNYSQCLCCVSLTDAAMCRHFIPSMETTVALDNSNGIICKFLGWQNSFFQKVFVYIVVFPMRISENKVPNNRIIIIIVFLYLTHTSLPGT